MQKTESEDEVFMIVGQMVTVSWPALDRTVSSGTGTVTVLVLNRGKMSRRSSLFLYYHTNVTVLS